MLTYERGTRSKNYEVVFIQYLCVALVILAHEVITTVNYNLKQASGVVLFPHMDEQCFVSIVFWSTMSDLNIGRKISLRFQTLSLKTPHTSYATCIKYVVKCEE